MVNQVQDDTPWYRCSPEHEAEPFILSKLISQSSNNPAAPPFHNISVFPWNEQSLQTLWDGEQVHDEELVSQWKKTIDQWHGTICVGSTGYVVVFPQWASGKSKPFKIRLPARPVIDGVDQSKYTVQTIAWALNRTNPTVPLIIFAAHSLIFVVDVCTKQVLSHLRGHGGEITTIAVHPKHPYIFCSTSKDMTTRLYDLTFEARQRPNNPHWPPNKVPSHAGPAFGLMSSESEGDGLGRCLAVFVGGRSGGHQAAVFAAAFHPSFHLIATCGMDRCVKIWRIPPLNEDKLAREDKPFFSTDLVHKARVLSISWLAQDTLISHSAPAIMRTYKDGGDEFYEEPGVVVVWRWLGFDRFFPPGKPVQSVVRGCASDYRGSQSFKIIASYSLPMLCRHISVYHDPETHDPILLVPDGAIIRIVNVTHFKPRIPPAFPLDNDTDEVSASERAEVTKKTRENLEREGHDEGEESDSVPPKNQWPELPVSLPLFEAVPNWSIGVQEASQVASTRLPEIEACAVAPGGGMVLGAGKRSTLYIWRLKTSNAP